MMRNYLPVTKICHSKGLRGNNINVRQYDAQ